MKEAWGKWGDADERGALNHIGTRQVRDAAQRVRQGKTISLAQPISATMPVPSSRPGVMHFMNRDGGDYAAGRRRPGGFQFADDTVVMPLHAGTHLDALCHCWYDDALYNGFSATEVRSNGAARLGIQTLGPIATTGVLLDFVALNGGPLVDGFAIGPDMVAAAIERTGAPLEAGDAVLLRTGWQERSRAGEQVDFDNEPGLDREAGLLIAEAGAALVGADNFAVEVLPFRAGTVFPVHQCLIRDYGITLLEGLELAELAAQCVPRFLFVAAALPIRGATGSPVNPVAIL
ncbi:MAG: cyclase family protein [Mesorhizobium sp.]